jgi:phosphoglycolate phosphatase-like HAD superfamily hydrolase
MSFGWILLFDWDGTLVNSLDIKVHHAGLLFAETFDLDPAEVEAAYRRHSGIPRQQLFNAICVDNGLSPLVDELFMHLSRRFSAMNLEALSNPRTQGLISSDTYQALQALNELGYPMYVSSSADPGEVQKVAVGLGLAPFFHGIMGSSPGFTKGKYHVEYVLRVHNTLADKVAFVGDEPADVILGRDAGVTTIAKAGTFSNEDLAKVNPDYIIASLSDLPELLQGNEGGQRPRGPL